MSEVLRWVLWIALAYVACRVIIRVEQFTFIRKVARRRRFTMAEYHQIVRRAGYRCEHYRWPWAAADRRCRSRATTFIRGRRAGRPTSRIVKPSARSITR